MSALWAPLDLDPKIERSNRSKDRRRLRAVPAPPPRLARIPFIAILIALFGLGMAGLLLLNTTLQDQAFEARRLTRSANELIYSQAELESEISRRSAPAELARRASALGMRPNPHPAFVVVPSGKVLGKPTRVEGREVPALIVKTPEELAAERAAAEAKRRAAAIEKAARQRAEQLAEARRAAEEGARAAQQAAARPPVASPPVVPPSAAQPSAARPPVASPPVVPPSAAQPSAARPPAVQPPVAPRPQAASPPAAPPAARPSAAQPSVAQQSMPGPR
jgi:hypothetical protein